MATSAVLDAPVDDVFRALADPTRRNVVARLTQSAASVSELAAPYDMALPSFVQHLRVLENCGVVSSSKSGRVRTYTLVPTRLRLAEDWLAAQRDMWDQRADRFARYVTDLDGQTR
jgi:DNA-binding transcriptional ArsR family regulator